MTSPAASVGTGSTVVGRVASAALVVAILSAALLGNVSVDAEPGSVVVPRAEHLVLLPEEYLGVLCAGFDYDPPPIPPSEIWPAQ
jgi:hypothetical protein